MSTTDNLAAERAEFEAWFDGFRHGWKAERDVAFDAWQARAALEAKPAEPVSNVMAVVEEAFHDGFTSPETYNDTVLNDPKTAWEAHREGYAKALAAPAAPAQVPLTLREQLDARTPWDELDAILPQNEQDAERYRWLMANPAWSVSYRIKPGKSKEYRMRDDEGDLWGNWWPTHEQAVDHAIAASKKENTK
jgi:hypothetical protein